MMIRQTEAGDVPALQIILDETELFPSELLPDMLDDGAEDGEDAALWLTALDGEQAVGFCYVIPEPMTTGTWNMLAIAVRPAHQGDGTGAALVAQAENALREQGARLLIVDTSGTEAFARTRAFYTRLNYTEESRIRDFWETGDDKVTFRKAL